MNYIKITKNDIANGIGIGCVLWVSGCDIHCKNCHNQSTWDFNAGQPFTEDTMQEILLTLTKPYISRFTLSGGHPLDPHNAPKVLEIVKRVKMVFPDKDIWIYSGYVWENIIKDETLREILKYTDVLVCINEEDYELAMRKKFKAKKIVKIDGVGVNLEKYNPLSL